MSNLVESGASAAAITFTPKPSVTVNVGRVPTDLYPRIDLDMPIWERAHAFQVNKTAIMNVDVDVQTQLDALGSQLNLSSIVDGSKASFLNYYYSHWMNFANLTIQSYHDSAGAVIPPGLCCVPGGGDTILKPVADGPINLCRPADIKFVRLSLRLDFAHLITAPVAPGDPAPVTILRAEFYMELPQTTVQVNNNNGVPRALTTWHGAADLSTLTPAQVSTEILQPTLRDSPILLSTADFNLPGIVRTSSVVIKAEIKEKILRLAFNQICHTLFRNLCPNYTDQPFAAVEVIKQSYIDADGNRVSSSVWAYHQRMILAMRPFVASRVFPVSVCNKFMDGLDPRIRRYFVDRYKDHWRMHDLDAAYQTAKLEEIYLAAIAAEEQYNTMNATAREAVGQPIGQTYSTAGAFPSQAENTLARYDSSSPTKRRSKNHKCFGCGSPDHAWQTKGVVTCPKGNQPEIQQAAKDNFNKWRDALRKKDRKKESPKRTLSYAELDDEAKKKMAQEVFQAHGTDSSSITSSITSPTAGISPVERIHRTLFCSIRDDETATIPVLTVDGAPPRRILPVAVTNAFPTIELPIGSPDDAQFPAIKCVIDTAAGLTTGNIRYIASLAKQYPHTLVRLYTPADYRPIVLSGIVKSSKDEEQFATCELDCAFEFHLPFYGRDGATISLVIATGPDVSINSILGLPFLKGSGAIVDLVNDVVELRHVDCVPFKFKMLRPSCYVPENLPPAADDRGVVQFQSVIQEVDNLVAHVCGRGASAAPISAVTARSVSFGSDSALESHPPSSAGSSNGNPPLSIVRWTPPISAANSFNLDHDPMLLGNSNSSTSIHSVSSSPAGEPSPATGPRLPIQVAPKPKRRAKPRNVFIDDRGFPDQSDEYDRLLRTIDGGDVLRKTKHPMPDLYEDDPIFNVQYDEALHGETLRKNLDLSHLDPDVWTRVLALIKKYWPVFEESTIFVPVRHYECVINTGSAPPIAVKKIHYGHREEPIMRRCIAALEKVGHIRQMHDGQWLFKCLLAPKPHQEHVYNIADFVWRFCVNYIPLNQITRIIAYPIPRCDTAVMTACGRSAWFWIFDAPMGYHQLAVAPESQEKLAFQGPDAIKWTYTVMPFGPVNGPATFISFIHDVSSVWKQLAADRGLQLNEDNNTTNIVDDIFGWGQTIGNSLVLIECQLIVAKAIRLSLSLRKSHIFPKRVEFVGIDVCPDGNRPAMSKFELLSAWPDPVIVRDVARLVGFGQFYSSFIPNFEILITPLREVMKEDYPTPITASNWSSEAQAAWNAVKNAIVSDPCLMRYDHRKLTVLRTDFSAIGFGYAACQPDNDPDSLAAMDRCMRGGGFDEFLTKTAVARLRPVAFGSRRCRNNEPRLHSHLGEGFAGDWAINKCRHMCFGQPFVWVTDCCAIKYILSYQGGNPAILRLQMRLMCWHMEIVHRADIYNVDADYWSRLDADLCYDPLLRSYHEMTGSLRSRFPPPEKLPIKPENMPYYRGPRRQPAEPDPQSETTVDVAAGWPRDDVQPSTFLAHVPVQHGMFPYRVDAPASPIKQRVLYNSNITDAGWSLSHFQWCIFGFGTGHFCSSIVSENIPFTIRYACDPLASGRALFAEFGNCTTVFGSATEMLHHIRSSGDTTPIHGYLIHSPQCSTADLTTQFWQSQAAIVAQLRLINRLCILVAFVHPDHDGRGVAGFRATLKRSSWLVSSMTVPYPALGDSIDGTCHVITAVHSSTMPNVQPLTLKLPPAVPPRPLGDFLWEPFNVVTYSLSLAPDDPAFDNRLAVTKPEPALLRPNSLVRVLYYVHTGSAEQKESLAGSSVIDTSGLCPELDMRANNNLFRNMFGIEFIVDGHRHIRAVSQFEVVRCFALCDNLSYRLSHPSNLKHLESGVPGRTSAWVFTQVVDMLLSIRNANVDRFDPEEAPLETTAEKCSVAQTFLNGTITTRLPDRARWMQEIAADDELTRIAQMVRNPALITKQNLQSVNYNYRHALRKSLIAIENGFLIYREPLVGGDSYTRLQLVPRSLRNIVFVAFHTNPIGGHFNAVRTFHRIRLRYYWPHMYKYIERMCRACPGCVLANRTHQKSAELVYNFPVEAPFLVLHCDVYVAGKFAGFEGCTVFLIACCGMCSFACMEPIVHANAESFASALMKIQLRFGLCHTVVLDKDSKFLGVFKESLDLLKIHYHILSGENHNPMLVERINRYLNKGLKIMTNERGSVRVAMESILLLLYAWNSCPIPGTDISRSLVAVGREFSFPIDFASNAHWALTHQTAPKDIVKYSVDLAKRLSASREVAELLVHEHRALHRELINSRRPDPRQYSVGDYVFARRAVRSDAAKERVDKLTYAYTGPWRVTGILPGGSYSLVHVQNEKRTQKKHASDLSPYPFQLLPQQLVDGPDSRYSQIYKDIIPNPFVDAGIEGFTPPQPFQTGVTFARVGLHSDFVWPSLADFNDELGLFNGGDIDAACADESADKLMDEAMLGYTGPPPPPPTVEPQPPVIPPISSLVASIIESVDRLFFVAHKIGVGGDIAEWRLIRVALRESMALHPSCLQDGRFLVDFYILHPADVRFNAVNQRYWIQYHPVSATPQDTTALDSHLIRPSDTSEAYAHRHHLVPCRRYVNLLHSDTYICGPFEFATIKGRKTRDRIAQPHWDTLARHSHMFRNPVPSTEMPVYSIHVDHTFHFSVQNVPFPTLTLPIDAVNPSFPRSVCVVGTPQQKFFLHPPLASFMLVFGSADFRPLGIWCVCAPSVVSHFGA